MPQGAEAAVCRRCLLSEMGGTEAEYYESVLKYRAGLPPGQKTGDEEYAVRLAQCRACDALMNGTCSHCGCYVEMRAAAKKMHCPLPDGARW